MKSTTHHAVARRAAIADLLCRWPLRLTLPAVLLGGALLTASSEYQLLLRDRYAWLVTDIQSQFDARAGSLARQIEADLGRGDQAAIDSLFAGLATESALVDATLRGPDGRIVAGTSSKRARLFAPANEILHARHAVRFAAPATGELHLAYDLAPRLAELRRDERLHAGYRMLLAGGFALLLWLYLDRVVVRRLRIIEQQAAQVRNGDFELPVAQPGNDEISAMSRALRLTAERLGEDRAALLERDQRMAQVMEAADLMVWEVDLTQRRMVLCERWSRMLGRPPGGCEMSTRDYQALIDPRDLESVRDAFCGYVDGALPSYVSEYRLHDAQGESIWVLDRGTAVACDEQGRKVRMIGVQLEISARKRADMQHRALLAAIPDLLVVVDADGTYREYHTLDPRVWIGPPSAMIGNRIVELLPPEPARLSMAAVAQVLKTNAPVDGQYEIDLPHGRRWREFRMVPYGNAQVLALVRDVTARKQAEEALRASEGRLRAMIENFPIGMFWCDAEGKTLFANAALHDAALPGTDPDPAAQGGRWLDAVHPVDRARMDQAWRDFVSGARSEYIEECCYVSARQGERLVRTWATPIRVDGRVQSYVGAVIDITGQRDAELQQRQLEKQLHHAQKMEALGALTGGVAHDFNNILASILGFAGLARQYFVPDPASKLATYLDAVLAAGERGRELVQKMLIFSRAQAGEVLSAVEPAPALKEVLGMLRAILPSTIRLDIEVDTAVPAILVDATELHQLVVNLAVNARDAIDGHGEITIELVQAHPHAATCSSCQQYFKGSYVELCVRDTGGPLPAEVLARMFEPFYSTKEVGQGTGLGLAVVHGVMHRCGGHVLVESAHGAGTRMRLLFQVAPASMLTLPPPVHAPLAPALSAARILLVDDEEQVTRFLSEMLQAEGHEVDSFTRAGEALAAFRAAPSAYDVVITDQTMPGMTGVELTAALHALRAELPVILCSGYSERVNAENYAEFGLFSYCPKPVSAARLREVLGEALAPSAVGALSSAG